MAVRELDEGFVVDDETGEVTVAPVGVDAVARLGWMRHDYKEQEETWKKKRQATDAALLGLMREKRIQTSGVLVTVNQRNYAKTDASEFAEWLATGALEWADLLAVIAASTGFKKDLLPESAREAFDRCTQHLPTRPWIESEPVLRRAS